VWDHGDEIWNREDGESPFPLGILHPDMPLDWAMDGVHGKNPSLAILEAIEGAVELKSSINYGKASLSLGVGKARLT